MANLHALRDDVVRKRVELITALNKMHEEDPKAAYESYTLCLQQIHDYFKGTENENGDPVNEQSSNLS